ncbi:UNVERIFIED_CONTAM: hypothetical protein K2H54_051350 [Gekko kuhli]
MGADSAGGGFLWLMLAWGLLRSQAACQTPPQGFRFVSYEVVIPKRLVLRRGRVPQDLTYLLEIAGKSLVVHLKQKKGLIPKHFPVFTYSKEGDLQVDYPFVRADCFYHGFVQGRPSSLVVLSSCSGGLRGLLLVESMTYEIEPVPASATFQHVVYLWEEKEHAVFMRCGLTEEEQNRQISVVRNTENVVAKTSPGGVMWSNTRHAKVAVVVEHERYVQFGRNETAVVMQEPLVLLEHAVQIVSFFQLEQFVEKGLASVISLNTALEFLSGVLKTFMYRMVLHAMTMPSAIMGNARLTTTCAK